MHFLSVERSELERNIAFIDCGMRMRHVLAPGRVPDWLTPLVSWAFKWVAGRLWSLSAIQNLLLYGKLSVSRHRSLYLQSFGIPAMATGSETGEGSGISNAQLEAMMSTIRQGLKEELTSMKRELAAEREAADEKLVKKLKLEKPPVFRKKGHEKQYLHNEEVRMKLSDARSAVSETPPAVEKAKTLLEEGEKLISERQKHIRIADRSDNGWATVEEYVEDELADNSDDEKRLSRADARAGKKLKSASQRGGKNAARKPGPKRFNSMGSRFPTYLPAAGYQPPVAQVAQPTGLYTQYGHPYGALQPGARWHMPGGTNPVVSGLGPCFECGAIGHLRKNCPKLGLGRATGTGTTNK